MSKFLVRNGGGVGGDAKKLDIVMSIGLDGATVTEVAHRHDVSRQQIYAWRHELKKKGLLPSSIPPVTAALLR
ncbi:transposase (plasmid) [Sinorhizobium meliloti]|nr:transposase [Sinorhizobium meliloti]